MRDSGLETCKTQGPMTGMASQIGDMRGGALRGDIDCPSTPPLTCYQPLFCLMAGGEEHLLCTLPHNGLAFLNWINESLPGGSHHPPARSAGSKASMLLGKGSQKGTNKIGL